MCVYVYVCVYVCVREGVCLCLCVCVPRHSEPNSQSLCCGVVTPLLCCSCCSCHRIGSYDFSSHCAARKRSRKSNAGVIAGAVIAAVVVVAAAVGGAVYVFKTHARKRKQMSVGEPVTSESAVNTAPTAGGGWAHNPLQAVASGSAVNETSSVSVDVCLLGLYNIAC